MNTSSISRLRARDQVQAPDRRQRRPGERDVDAVLPETGLELARGERLGLALERRLELPAGLVGGLADRAALLGRQLGDTAQ